MLAAKQSLEKLQNSVQKQFGGVVFLISLWHKTWECAPLKYGRAAWDIVTWSEKWDEKIQDVGVRARATIDFKTLHA